MLKVYAMHSLGEYSQLNSIKQVSNVNYVKHNGRKISDQQVNEYVFITGNIINANSSRSSKDDKYKSLFVDV